MKRHNNIYYIHCRDRHCTNITTCIHKSPPSSPQITTKTIILSISTTNISKQVAATMHDTTMRWICCIVSIYPFFIAVAAMTSTPSPPPQIFPNPWSSSTVVAHDIVTIRNRSSFHIKQRRRAGIIAAWCM
ncbi:Hypothetical predicted protein [Olea europaea subsp. europaea]|uniref:Uncharacterized protein n=1 Tax=Olea europaea subsp. europaea TaxID=158383 RepID=A0A8S0PV14_OLEEU|nr:Hypothetical predicted protein [Olea europaea subsp. europaea]